MTDPSEQTDDMEEKVPSSLDAALADLKAALLALKATGITGFEGLVADALEETTGIPFRLSASGSQRGVDAAPVYDSDSIGFEAKRYDGPISSETIYAKLTQLSIANPGLDLWILAASAPVPAQLAQDVHVWGEKNGVGVLILDWTGARVTPLAASLALAERSVVAFLRKQLSDESADKVQAALGVIRRDHSFASHERRLRSFLEGATTSRGKAGRKDLLIVVDKSLVLGNRQLRASVDELTEREVESAWDLVRQGKPASAETCLIAVKDDLVRWDALSETTKGSILRLQSTIAAEIREELDEAQRLLDEARALDPNGDDIKQRAILAHQTDGFDAAVQVIGDSTDARILNLKALLLLSANKLDEAGNLLLKDGQPVAETHRIRALWNFLRGERSNARREIDFAKSLEPSWKSIRELDAQLLFAEAISPAVPLKYILPWPQPFDTMLVRSDDHAKASLRAAQSAFAELEKMDELPAKTRRIYETWHLASLANDPTRVRDAADYCRYVLTNTPDHVELLEWIVARDLDVDTTEVSRRLEGRSDPSVRQAHALGICLMRDRRVDELIGLLGRQKRVFVNAGSEETWKILYARALSMEGKREEAEKLLELGSNHELNGNAALIPVVDFSTVDAEDARKVCELLETNWESNGSVASLVESQRLRASRQEWAVVSSYVAPLVEKVGTAESIELAFWGLYKSANYPDALAVLDANAKVFPNGEIPDRLGAPRLHCLVAEGRYYEAAPFADQLFARDDTTQNGINLARVLYRSGSLPGVVRVARRLLGRADLPVDAALQLSMWCATEQRDLARKLWKRAVGSGIPDEAVGFALGLGFQLGLDDELRELTERMVVLAREGRYGMWAVTFEEIVTQWAEWREHRAELYSAYATGAAPIHLFSKETRTPLSEIYHANLDQIRDAAARGEKAPLLRYPTLYLRHGGKRILDVGNPASWMLHLDTTALLIAWHLGILEKVEQAFGQLHIPAELPMALMEMIKDLSPHQPKQLERAESVLKALDQGLLEELHITAPSEESAELRDLESEIGASRAAALQRAVEEGAFLLCRVPLMALSKSRPAEIAPEYRLRLVDSHDIARTLEELGVLSDGDRVRLEERSEAAVAENQSVAVGRDATVFCEGSAVEELHDLGLLERAAHAFRLCVESNDVREMRDTVAEAKRRAQLARWCKDLLDHINTGLETRNYATIAQVSAHDGTADPLKDSLLSLLRIVPSTNALVWVDDRFVSSHERAGTAIICGVNDILLSLRHAEVLSQEEYFDTLCSLREVGAGFIPLDGTEIAYQVRLAAIRDGSVEENRQLRALRRHTAWMLSRPENLQVPPMPEGSPNPSGELHFLLSIGREPVRAAVELWSDASGDVVSRKARARWVMENLYYDQSLLVRTYRKDSQATVDWKQAAAGNAAMLLASAMHVDLENTQSSIRPELLAWLYQEFIAPHAECDPTFLPTLCQQLKIFFTAGSKETKKGMSAAMKALEHRILESLPAPVREQLLKDEGFLGKQGLKVVGALQFGGRSFAARDFLREAQAAFSGKATSIVDTSRTGSWIVTGYRDVRMIELRHVDSGEVIRVLLRERPAEIVSLANTPLKGILEDRPSWTDGLGDERDETLERILGLGDVVEQVLALDDVVHESTEWHAERLRSHLASEPKFSESDLDVGSPTALLQFLRIKTSGESVAVDRVSMERSARDLLRDRGVCEAVRRLSMIPLPLPPNVVEAFLASEPGRRRMQARMLLAECHSSLQAIHMARLLWATDDRALKRLARRIVGRLASPQGQKEFATFQEILQWSNGQGSLRRGKEIKRHLIATWIRAGIIYESFVCNRAEIETLGRIFSNFPRRIPREWLDQDAALLRDVAYPYNLDYARFLASGLSFYLSDITIAPEDIASLSQVVLAQRGDKRILTPSLLAAPGLMGNVSGSILQGETRELIAVLCPDEADILALSSNLTAFLDQTLALLTNEATMRNWLVFDACIGRAELPRELWGRFEELILECNLSDPGLVNSEKGCYPLVLASNLSSCLSLRATNRLVEQMYAVADLAHDGLSVPVGKEGTDVLHMQLLECAVALAARRSNPHQALREFVEGLGARCPAILETFQDALVRIYRQQDPAAEPELGRILPLLRSW